MRLRILNPSEYRTMPWRNGQGTTQEIALCTTPEDAGQGTFVWRLSLAAVGASSPFSCFPHCDRTILLLAGEGMVLDSGAHGRHVLARPFEPYAFRGEWQTDCMLLGGPCRDFNAMVDRRRARAVVAVHTLSAPSRMVATVALAAHTLAAVALDGDVQIVDADAELAGQGATPLLLSCGATLLCEAETPQPRTWTLQVTARADTVRVLTVAITHHAA